MHHMCVWHVCCLYVVLAKIIDEDRVKSIVEKLKCNAVRILKKSLCARVYRYVVTAFESLD